MTPRLSPLRLSIVDFLGVFLPGSVWAILMITTLEVFGWSELTGDSTPLSAARRLLGVSQAPPAGPSFGLPFYTGLALFSLLMGYLVKAFSARPAEWIAFRIELLRSKELREACKERKDDYRFPYAAKHQDKPYFTAIEKIIKSRLGYDWEELPGYQPFESCKRLLRVYAPALWEEAQQREAQVRFLVSFSLAALYSTALSFVSLAKDAIRGRGAADSFWWLCISALVSVLLSTTLWTRRHREVEDVYLSILIVNNLPASGMARGSEGHEADEGD
ncbi:MAG: hypothetical protein ABUT39_21710 [Acidobacteriota bacterium]